MKMSTIYQNLWDKVSKQKFLAINAYMKKIRKASNK